MSKRLQVLLDERELRELRRTARRERLTVSEWVRQTLRTAWRRAPSTESAHKLEVIRAAARHAAPTADIDQMLREIERGYLGEANR